ncbi:MAG: hypothetical protein U1G08_00805 [Verrucomicrobiota bacterium]
MKSPIAVALAFSLIAIAPAGCGKKDSADVQNPTVAAITVDTSKLRSAFASAKGELKANLDRAVNAISDRDFSGAGTFLQKMAAEANLSADQKTALNDLLAQVKERGAELMQSAGKAAGGALDQAKGAAEKAAVQVKDATGKAVDAAGKAATDASKKAQDLLPK